MKYRNIKYRRFFCLFLYITLSDSKCEKAKAIVVEQAKEDDFTNKKLRVIIGGLVLITVPFTIYKITKKK